MLLPARPFFETFCDDSHRLHLARHRGDGHARRYRDGIALNAGVRRVCSRNAYVTITITRNVEGAKHACGGVQSPTLKDLHSATKNCLNASPKARMMLSAGYQATRLRQRTMLECIFRCIHSRVHPLTLTSNSPQKVFSGCSPCSSELLTGPIHFWTTGRH